MKIFETTLNCGKKKRHYLELLPFYTHSTTKICYFFRIQKFFMKIQIFLKIAYLFGRKRRFEILLETHSRAHLL